MNTKAIKVEMDGNAWCATRDGFINLQICPAGFGDTPQEAINELLEEELKEPCKHEWTKWEVREDDICSKCGMCVSEFNLLNK